MITGAHTILFSTDAAADRAFLLDALGFESVDAGDGWLIFALPPSELAVHPGDEPGRCELYLMCDDLEATLRTLAEHGAPTARPVSRQAWGRVAAIRLPSGAELPIYEPTHPLPPRR